MDFVTDFLLCITVSWCDFDCLAKFVIFTCIACLCGSHWQS